MVNINVGKMISNTGKAIVDKTSKAFHLDIFSNEKSDEDKFFQLKLDIIGEETFTADCDVTDHYVESNNAYQDQISLKPKMYSVQGEVGELVWYQNDPNEQILGQVSQRLEGLISFLPIRSKSFNTMKTKAMKALQWVDTASNVASKLTNLYNDTAEGKQQQAYINLCKYRDERQHLNVVTPWGILENYVITNLKLTQPKETKDKTYISLTFKELRTTSLSFVDFDPDKYQGNAIFENQPEIDNGKVTGEDASLEYKEMEVNDIPLEHSIRTGDAMGDYEDVREVELIGGDSGTFAKTKSGEWVALYATDSNGTVYSPDSVQGQWIVGGESQESIKRRIANAG